MPVFKNRVGFIRQFKEYVDFVADKSAYAGLIGRLRSAVCGLARGEVLTSSAVVCGLARGNRLTQALKKHFQWKTEKLNAGYEHFKGAYQSAQTLPSSGQCAEDIVALNISEAEAIK